MSSERPSRVARLRLVAAVVLAASLVQPAMSAASPGRAGQEGPSDTSGHAADDAGRGGALDIDVDALRDQDDTVDDTLTELTDNVQQQLDQLEQARDDLSSAEEDLDNAQAAVAATRLRIVDLTARSDDVVVEAFMNPPTEQSLDAFTAPSLAAAAVKQSILDTHADDNADVLEQLGEARDDLEVQEANEEEIAGAAEEARDDAQRQYDDLEAAQSQQALFIAQVNERLERNLAEADAIAARDPELAAQLRARESGLAQRVQDIRDARAYAEALAALELQRQQAEAEAAAEAAPIAASGGGSGGGTTAGPATGSLATVACPGGGSITVDSSIASNLENMLGAASADGVQLCGGGYRDPAEQIALRQQNCGTSNYDIYEAPSSSCSPPTARPGTSNHEQGLAIDFTCNGGGTISSRSSPCFVWLDNNAASYGFYNLPSEPWHWSVDGT